MRSRPAIAFLLTLASLLVLVLTLPAVASTPKAAVAAAQPLSGLPLVEALPEGVHIETVLEGMHLPIAMAFDPEGRLLCTEKDGNVRLFADGKLQADPVINY